MKVFAISDLHVDYEINARWVEQLSTSDYRSDVLILAGDISDSLQRLDWCLAVLCRRFAHVLFVPGNHDLWVLRDADRSDSMAKFRRVCDVAEQNGASMSPLHLGSLSIVPLFGWYDHSFGLPSPDLRRIWMDYRACRWPGDMSDDDITSHFLAMNTYLRRSPDETIISFSHFLPRIDVMPHYIGASHQALYPVLGTSRLGAHVRTLGSAMHVYGHSHVNQRLRLDGTTFINNAFAYPHEGHIAERALLCIHEK